MVITPSWILRTGLLVLFLGTLNATSMLPQTKKPRKVQEPVETVAPGDEEDVYEVEAIRSKRIVKGRT
eukprot:5379915-Prymnesium_polylepis.1